MNVLQSFAFILFITVLDVYPSLGCDFDNIPDCLLRKPDSSLPDQEYICSKAPAVKDCISKKVDGCEESKKRVANNIISAKLNPVLSSCKDNSGDLYCQSYYTTTCKRHLNKSEDMDYSEFCSQSKKVFDCMTGNIDSCSSDLKNTVLNSQMVASLKEDIALCTYHKANPEASSCSAQQIWNCRVPVMKFSGKEHSQPKIFCFDALVAAYCELRQIDHCPDSLKEQLSITIGKLEKTRDKCQPYVPFTPTPPPTTQKPVQIPKRIKVDLFCTVNDNSECLNPKIEYKNYAVKILDDWCPTIQGTYDCFKQKEDCKELPIYQKLIPQCEYYMKTKVKNDSSDCDLQEAMNCDRVFVNVGSSIIYNDKAYCRKVLEQLECSRKVYDTCPESLRAKIKKVLTDNDLLQESCYEKLGIKIEKTTKSGPDGNAGQIIRTNSLCHVLMALTVAYWVKSSFPSL